MVLEAIPRMKHTEFFPLNSNDQEKGSKSIFISCIWIVISIEILWIVRQVLRFFVDPQSELVASVDLSIVLLGIKTIALVLCIIGLVTRIKWLIIPEISAQLADMALIILSCSVKLCDLLNQKISFASPGDQWDILWVIFVAVVVIALKIWLFVVLLRYVCFISETREQ